MLIKKMIHQVPRHSSSIPHYSSWCGCWSDFGTESVPRLGGEIDFLGPPRLYIYTALKKASCPTENFDLSFPLSVQIVHEMWKDDLVGYDDDEGGALSFVPNILVESIQSSFSLAENYLQIRIDLHPVFGHCCLAAPENECLIKQPSSRDELEKLIPK